jgi:hypothetical protein
MRLSTGRHSAVPAKAKTLLFDVLAGLLAVASFAAGGQSPPHLSNPHPGGMPGLPELTGVTRTTNGVTITWSGPSGSYQLLQKETMTDTNWQAVGGATNSRRQATVQATSQSAIFLVSGPAPQYAGIKACASCHTGIVGTEEHTAHAAAFTNHEFVVAKGQTNGSCLSCHTVGYGLSTGFVSLAKTPGLAGVQCENCHGPAAYHAGNPDDPTLVPQVELASALCGGCHANRYSEWQTSAHPRVISNLNASTEINNCGRCHSASARLSLIQGQAPIAGDASLGIQCISCHDPHKTNGNPAQLIYPLASMQDYYMPTNGSFASHYNPKINVCGQCHNHAGASWTNTAAQPHLSPQYNMLLGTIGEVSSGLPPKQPGSHAILLTNQCVECHMQTTPFVNATNLGDGGHTFRVDRYDVCLKCHPLPQLLVQFVQGAVSNEVQTVKLDLDYWATNSAPAALRNKYGARAWEFTAPGVLSPGGPGPDAKEQAQIPVNIRKARFNVYVVLSDGSLGVHNPEFSVTLLQDAETWIAEELSK